MAKIKEVKPEKKYKDVAPVLYDLGVTEAFVDKDKPEPGPEPTPSPVLTKAKAEAALDGIKLGHSFGKLARETGCTTAQVKTIYSEAVATWGLKEDGTVAIPE